MARAGARSGGRTPGVAGCARRYRGPVTSHTSETAHPAPRTPTAIDEIAEQHVHDLVALDPILATDLGLPGRDGEMPDWSPEGHDARAALARRTLERLAGQEPADETDRVTVAAMQERLGVEVDMADASEDLRDLNVLHSPAQEARSIFDLMATQTEENWADVAGRLSRVPDALRGYRASLSAGRQAGAMPARRQVEAVAEQARKLADPTSSFFRDLVDGARPDGTAPSGALAGDLADGATAAARAYGELADFLQGDYAADAPVADGVGRERYELYSRQFLGARIDLEETYHWGLAELASIDAEQKAIIRDLFGEDLPVTEAFARLDADPERQLHGTAALQAWMQRISDQAIADLDGTMLDIPEPLHRLECRIAPTSSGGIYYTGPSQDFSRPGRMWWAVPEGTDTFSTWQERTTVYHEGVPGHHLQIGYTTYLADRLNLWRRSNWISGHGEGWALYAERLMDALGHLPDPADRLGMLDGQRLRAARVALDIGVHLGLDFPADLVPTAGPGAEAGRDVADWSRWDADTAWAFLRDNVAMEEGFLRFEWQRYLGWPGQAPSYKVGERLWLAARDEFLAARPDAPRDAALREFHERALSLGSLGLDVLPDALRA